LLNQVFWLVFDDSLSHSWRSMSNLACDTMKEVEQLADSQYLFITASRSGSALSAVPKISKNLVVYMAGLLAVSPYRHGPFNFAKGVAQHTFGVAGRDSIAQLHCHS
jgi:hypothetical protein